MSFTVKVKQDKLEEKLGERGFHYDTRWLFDRITKAVANANKELIREIKSTLKANKALNRPNISYLNPLLEIAFDRKIISFDLIDELLEIMTKKNTSYFGLKRDKNSGLVFSKTVTAVPLANENETFVLKNGPCKRYELDEDVLELLTYPKIAKGNSEDG